MDDWLWVESPGTSLNEEPLVRSAKFGDGYEQRAPAGLNPRAGRTWPMQFTNVDDAIATEMVEFLRSKGGVVAFGYVPLWETVKVAVICRSWTRSRGSDYGTSNVSGTFEWVPTL